MIFTYYIIMKFFSPARPDVLWWSVDRYVVSSCWLCVALSISCAASPFRGENLWPWKESPWKESPTLSKTASSYWFWTAFYQEFAGFLTSPIEINYQYVNYLGNCQSVKKQISKQLYFENYLQLKPTILLKLLSTASDSSGLFFCFVGRKNPRPTLAEEVCDVDRHGKLCTVAHFVGNHGLCIAGGAMAGLGNWELLG